MGFQAGLSGLNAASKNLDVIGNNVANANTVGFKQSQAQFADVYAAALTGAGGSQIGIGTQLAAVAQQFTQGNISVTNNALDMAINGQGFFRMDDNGAISYARNGQFQLDKDGFIVSSQGNKLTGFAADVAGNIVAAAPVPLQIPTADLVPRASTAVEVGLNLDARDTVPTTALFNPNDPTSYNRSTSTTIYDSLGNNHIATMYFAKAAAPVNTWNTYMTVNNLAPNGAAATATNTLLGSMTFSPTGLLASTVPATVPLGTFTVPGGITYINGSVTPQPMTLDFLSSTQFGAAFGVNKLSQDGFTSGRLNDFSASADGVILGRYTNGQSRALGQVVLANFSNPQGLQPFGGNEWGETSTSGAPLVGAPGSGSLGVLQSAAVEDSNVDLTAELVNMIMAQRVYQANAQTIKAQDAILQTLVNLR